MGLYIRSLQEFYIAVCERYRNTEERYGQAAMHELYIVRNDLYDNLPEEADCFYVDTFDDEKFINFCQFIAKNWEKE